MKGAKQKQKAAPFKGQLENNGRGQKRLGKGNNSELSPLLSIGEEKKLGNVVKGGLEEMFEMAMGISLGEFEGVRERINEYNTSLQFNRKDKRRTAKWRVWEEASALFKKINQSKEKSGKLNGKITDFNAKYREIAEAMEKMAVSNLGLVISIAQKYHYPGLPIPDLIQEGNLGLIKSLITFDCALGRLGTYVFWGIRRAILKAIKDKSRLIRLPIHINNLVFKVFCASRDLLLKLEREPLPEEIAQHTGIALTDVKVALENIEEPIISMDTPRYGKDKKAKILDFIASQEPWPIKEIADSELAKKVRALLFSSSLLPREAEILRQKFGLNQEGEEYTLQEIADQSGVSRQCIHQTKNAGLRRLRKIAQKEGLEVFLRD